MNPAWWLNTAWMTICRGQLRALRQAARDVAGAQAALLLREIIAPNRHTDFGRRHGFDRIGDVRQYQRRVPLATYDDYAASVDRIAVGEPNVLTREPVRLLQPTSGTTRGEKLIPYTASLGRQFQRGIAAWIADLMARRPAVRRGRAYWSISPAFGPARRTGGGLTIGFDDDTAYLGRIERLLAGRLLAVPPAVARLPEVECFRYATLLHLLRAGDLALVSVWNPTFLTALVAGLEGWQDRLCHDIARGAIDVPPGCRRAAASPAVRFRFDPRRAAELRSIFASGASLPERLRQLWPRLALVSCWADGSAAWGVPELRRLLPWVEIQPKGLLATEGFVSLPLVGRPGAVLAVRSHFFEFEEAAGGASVEKGVGTCRLAHELETGGRYRVVLTTGGGLYRYRLHDEVEVVGFEHRCPLVRFLGKADRTSDLVGEKLTEPHVREVLQRVFASSGVSPSFALLVPVRGRPPYYRLYVEGHEPRGAMVSRRRLADALENGLEENPHYGYAVRLGQLAPAEVSLCDQTVVPLRAVYERRCLAAGQKLGDIKPAALDPRLGWPDAFAQAIRGPLVAALGGGYTPGDR